MVNDYINEYLKKGFGSMNKNDFEVWIFNYLLQNQLKEMNNNSISHYLKIPETKVKRLRYEATLKYGVNVEKQLCEDFKRILRKANLKGNHRQLSFVIEDITLRRYLDSILKTEGSYSDSSFNSEIVTIDFSDMTILMEKTFSSEDKALVKSIKSFKNKEQFKAIMKELLKSLPTLIEGEIVNLGIEGLCELLKKKKNNENGTIQ